MKTCRFRCQKLSLKQTVVFLTEKAVSFQNNLSFFFFFLFNFFFPHIYQHIYPSALDSSFSLTKNTKFQLENYDTESNLKSNLDLDRDTFDELSHQENNARMDDSIPLTPELPERKNRLSSSSGIKRNKVSRACDECRKRKVNFLLDYLGGGVRVSCTFSSGCLGCKHCITMVHSSIETRQVSVFESIVHQTQQTLIPLSLGTM